jgi:hypothetical protein
MSRIVLIATALSLSTGVLDAQQLRYRIRNKSDHLIVVRLIPDRNMDRIIIDSASNNDIYEKGILLKPDQSALVNFAISGKSKTISAIKKHWRIELIQVVAQNPETDSLAYFKFHEIAKADARKDLIITISNPSHPGAEINITYQ